MTEEEKRLHRCCFSGHRPEKLKASEKEVRQWLEEQIDRAVSDGYQTFISGCAMGVDIRAGDRLRPEKRHRMYHRGITIKFKYLLNYPRQIQSGSAVFFTRYRVYWRQTAEETGRGNHGK